jgi:beta-lactamase superfamily II metal-dependent hydrolase
MKKNVLFVLGLAVLFGAFVFVIPAFAQNLEIHQINVSNGNAVFIKGPNGTTILYDSGDSGRGSTRVLPFLQSPTGGGMPAPGGSPRTALTYAIMSHQDSDHLGGADEIFGAGSSLYDVQVKNYFNGSTKTGTQITEYLNAASATTAGTAVRMPVGTIIDLGGGATVTCVANWNESTSLWETIAGTTVSGVSNSNDLSVALLVECGGFDYLVSGDLGGGAPDACTARSTTQMNLETTLINALISTGMISSGGIDVLGVSHHGSESSTNPDLMNVGRPEVALIATGNGQSSGWNFPRADVVDSVLLKGATCITAPAVQKPLQTEMGNGVSGPPGASNMSDSAYCVGNIKIVVNCASGTYTISADGAVTYGTSELAASGLPTTLPFDEGGCNKPTVAPTATGSTSGCTAVATGLRANASGGSGTYPTYSWTPATGLSCTNCANPNASVTATTTYTVTVTDSRGCTSSGGQITLTVSNLAVAPTATPAQICVGSWSLLQAGASGGIGALSYEWRIQPGGALVSTSLSAVVTPSTTTTYAVTVTDTVGCQATGQVTVVLSGGTPPSPPSSVTAGGGNGSVALSWSAVTGAVSYQVYRSNGGCGNELLVQTVTAPTTTWTDSTVVNGTTYCYSVAAANASCQGSAGPCGPVSCATPGPVPEVSGGSATVHVTVEDRSSSSFAFAFQDLGGSYAYHLYAVGTETNMDNGIYSAKWCNLATNTAGTFSTSAGKSTWTVLNGSAFPDLDYVVVAELGATEGPYGFKSTGEARNPDDDRTTPADAGCAVVGTPKVVISQVYGGGGNAGSTYKSDYIELHNAGTASQDLTGWSVQYASATGSSWTNRTNLSGSIPAGGYFLVQEYTGSGGGLQSLPTPDVTGSINMSATAGKVALVASTTSLSGTCPTDATIQDLVGYGSTASCYEGTGRAPGLSDANSNFRKTSGCQDTNDNSADFTAGAAYPNARNSATTAYTCP